MDKRIIVNLESEDHIKYIDMLINLTITNFITRYCTDQTKRTIIPAFLMTEPQINYINYVWDCFQHVFKRSIFKEIWYLDIPSQDEVFSLIIVLLDAYFFPNKSNDN